MRRSQRFFAAKIAPCSSPVESERQFTISVDNFVGKLRDGAGKGRQTWVRNELPKDMAPINRFKSIT